MSDEFDTNGTLLESEDSNLSDEPTNDDVDTSDLDSSDENDKTADSDEEATEGDVNKAEELILGKYKTIEDANKGLSERQSMLDKKETESMASLQKEIEETKALLKQTTGISDKSQMEIFQVSKQISEEFFGKEVGVLSKYFNLPTDTKSNEFADSYGRIVNDLSGSIALLSPQQAALFTTELLNLKSEKEQAQGLVHQKQLEWTNSNNESVKQSLSNNINDAYKDQPEELKTDVLDLFNQTIADYQKQGIQIDADLFTKDIEKLSNISKKSYQLGLSQGKKDGQLDTSNNSQAKKLGGLGGDGKQDASSLEINSKTDLEAISAKEMAQYMLK